MNGTVSEEALSEALATLMQQSGLIVADEWLTLPEAMAVAKTSRTRLYEWMAEGLPYLDESPRQIRRSALMTFMAEKEVVMVRGKKVPAQRTNTKRDRRAPVRRAAGSARPATSPRTSSISGATDREALLALLSESRKAA